MSREIAACDWRAYFRVLQRNGLLNFVRLREAVTREPVERVARDKKKNMLRPFIGSTMLISDFRDLVNSLSVIFYATQQTAM